MIENLPVRTLQHKAMTIEGYSRAAVQSYWRIPELKLGFDLGGSPWSFMGTQTFFVTHSHLDHIASIPLLVDTVFGMREKPVYVHATAETWAILKDHVFNWKVWPDFTVIPDADHPFLIWNEIRIGETVDIDGRRFTPIPANHVVPAVGYHLEGKASSMVFTGDTANHYILSLLHPEWEVRFDMNKAEAAASRKKVFDLIATDKIAFLGYHMPFPAVGFVEKQGAGYRFVPKSYQFDI